MVGFQYFSPFAWRFQSEQLQVRIDQSGKFSALTLLRAMDPKFSSDAEILKLFYKTEKAKTEGGRYVAKLEGRIAVDDVVYPKGSERAGEIIVDAGCKTNIHYVLGNFSIDEAADRLDGFYEGFPEGINAVVFLAHKPVGLGDEEQVLKAGNFRVKRFFDLIDNMTFPYKVGFDSCSVPGILNYTSKIDRASIDTCEGARWSMYISADMMALPCSFDQDHRWGVQLKEDTTIQNAWNGAYFEDFRNSFRTSCKGCKDVVECKGGCPIKKQVVLCDRSERT